MRICYESSRFISWKIVVNKDESFPHQQVHSIWSISMTNTNLCLELWYHRKCFHVAFYYTSTR